MPSILPNLCVVKRVLQVGLVEVLQIQHSRAKEAKEVKEYHPGQQGEAVEKESNVMAINPGRLRLLIVVCDRVLWEEANLLEKILIKLHLLAVVWSRHKTVVSKL